MKKYIALMIVFALTIFIYNDFIFGNKLYLFRDIGSDTVNIFYPMLINSINSIKESIFPLYSFRNGTGSNIVPFVYNNPFNYIIYVLGLNNIIYSVFWIEVIKILLIALIGYNWLKLLGYKYESILIGIVSICFCGFMNVAGTWWEFSAYVFYLMLLLYSFEMLYHKKIWLYPIAVAFTFICNPSYAFIICLPIIPYLIYRYNKTLLIRTAIFTILGIVISSFFTLQWINVILNSPRIGSGAMFHKLSNVPVFGLATALEYKINFYSMFGNNILGDSSKFVNILTPNGGNINYLERLLGYMGLLPILMLPISMIVLNKRQRVIILILLVLISMFIIFPYFRYAIWLFSGDYYRITSMFVVLPIVLIALKTIDALNIKRVFAYVIILLVCAEFAYSNSKTINSRVALTEDDFKKEVLYNDEATVYCLNYLKDNDKGFYRVSKNYICNPGLDRSYGINEAQAYGYNGTATYSSFNNKYYIRFLAKNKIVDSTNRISVMHTWGVMDYPYLERALSVKYFLSRGITNSPLYNKILTHNGITLYRNKYFLPLGFCVNGNEKMEMVSHSSNNIKGNVLLRGNRSMFYSIPYDDGWIVKVDNNKIKTFVSNDGFIGINVNKGFHRIELNFIPRWFYLGIILSFVGIAAYIGMLLFVKFKV